MREREGIMSIFERGKIRKPECGVNPRRSLCGFFACLYRGNVLLALILIFHLSSFIPLHAAKIYHAAGTTSAAFLKLGVGARATAMGGAFAGVTDDPYSIYWNPAGLASLEGEKNIGFFHNDHFQGLKQEFMLYTAPAEGLTFLKTRELRSGIWGVGLDYFYTPKDMERRSGLNESDPLAPISLSEGKFGAYDMAVSLGYGWQPETGLGVGFAFKVIRQSIDNRSAATAALDLGVMKDYTWFGEDFTAGLSVQNIGPGIKFISERYDLPLVFKAGLSRRLPGSGALFLLEADKPIDNYPSFILGAELPVVAKLALRTGYRYRHNGNELGPWSGFSAGAGLTFSRFSFDYSFSPFGELGNSHRFSLNARFGGGAASLKGFKGSAQPDGAMRNSRTVSYAVSPKAIMLSQRGVKYQIRAVSESADLYAFSFRTMVRGPVAADISVTEGELPQVLASRLPAGMVQLKAWEFYPGIGDMQSDITFELRSPKVSDGKKYSFLYLTKNGWKEIAITPAREDAELVYFEVSVPFSTHYMLGEMDKN